MKPTKPTCRGSDSEIPGGDCRCLCGSLLARVVEGGVELKCRRCKRALLLPFEAPEVLVATAKTVESIPVRRTG